jgi:cell division topological specificity factor
MLEPLARRLARKSVGIFSFFRTSPPERSADRAKERLQVLLALERKPGNGLSFLPQLQEDIIKVISKYVPIDNDKVMIEVERGMDVSMLDINIELPATVDKKDRKGRKVPLARVAATT